jgi:hypothetical protein
MGPQVKSKHQPGDDSVVDGLDGRKPVWWLGLHVYMEQWWNDVS